MLCVNLAGMITLARISIYPFKSLDPVVLPSVRVHLSGGLQDDRRYAFRDETGSFVNGKRNARVHTIRSEFDVESRVVTLKVEGNDDAQAFHVDRDRSALERWFSAHFDMPVTIAENAEAGFPDDPETPGPTFVSTATLEVVAEWFGMTLDEARRRFRANLEIDGGEPFWEDRLFAAVGNVVRFTVGRVSFEGTNPCARCVVPSRSSFTGFPDSMFQKRFADCRRETLPSWFEPSRFDHFYRLTVNTRPVVATLPGSIQIGDELKIDGIQPL